MLHFYSLANNYNRLKRELFPPPLGKAAAGPTTTIRPVTPRYTGIVSSETISSKSTSTQQTMQVVRGAFHLATVIIVTVWGFLDWALPYPGILVGAGALVLSVVIWALFLSPRPVLHTDRYGLALIELLFLASGAGALLALGFSGWIAAAFGLVGAALGYASALRTR